MKRIIYPGTFDPVTHGHSNLIERAARLFDEVIVAVADSRRKAPLFSTDERVQLIQTVCAGMANVSVMPFSGLIVDVARREGCQAVLRGVRSMADFEYELQMAGMNNAMDAGFETVFLTPATACSYISSTLVREIAGMHGDVAQFVHPAVLAALSKKFQ
ncbi:MAG TPA: pantetheine-phosphate adenylyltransferase [Pseudomonadales bacterium]